MFWDKAASFYDFFETIYNRKVYKEFPLQVATIINEGDKVLECACGTGVITKAMASKGASIIATDFSEGMLHQARKKCKALDNVTIHKADIMHLNFADNSFDKVVAGNVIHLLDNPKDAMKELSRVCKPDGLIILPTYINKEKTGKPLFIVRLLKAIGVDFKMQFTMNDYKEFITRMGFPKADFYLVNGKMPNAIAVIRP